MGPETKTPLGGLLAGPDRAPAEAERLADLFRLFARLPDPPDPYGLVPRWGEFKGRLVSALRGDDPERIEEAGLTLYAHLHGHEAPYTRAEQRRRDATGGYWNHAGGLSPVLKAPEHLRADSVSVDFGAGNGLQLLLMQHLAPHARSVQVELSSKAVAFGRELQAWLGIDRERLEWRVADVMEAPVAGHDFIYLYRPVKPQGEGRRFYERFAAELGEQEREVVVYSIADCLRDFLGPRFEVFYSDGQLTCFRG